MRKDREFENILDECLEKMLQGKTVEQCLADYPDHAAALEPMLRTVVKARMATQITPRPEFKDRARHQFQAAIREMETKPVRERRGFFPSLKPAWIALAALVAIVVAGGGTVYAASNSLPDSPLYQVKLATESVRLALTPSDIGKAELYAKFADERVEEIVKMADKGKVDLVHAATERLNDQLVAMASLDIVERETTADSEMLAFESAEPSAGGETQIMATVPPATPTMAPAPAPAPVTVRPPDSEKNGQLGTEERAPTTVSDAALSAAAARPADDDSQEDGALDRERRLKELLLRRAIENPEALKEALKTAPESLREILNWAIEVADAGYDEAIKNLE